MGTVMVDWVVRVFLPSDGDTFDLLLVVTLLGVLKDLVDPVRWLICVEESPVVTC